MRWVGFACFPLCTKIDGLETVQHLTLQQSDLGVLLKQNMSMNCGDTVPAPVSIAFEI